MRPVPIPDHLVPPACKRVVIGPADGDPTGDIRPVEAIAGIVDGVPNIVMLVELEDGDLERLTDTPAVWLTMQTGQIPPWSIHIADDQDWTDEDRERFRDCQCPTPNPDCEHPTCPRVDGGFDARDA